MKIVQKQCSKNTSQALGPGGGCLALCSVFHGGNVKEKRGCGSCCSIQKGQQLARQTDSLRSACY